MTESPAVNLPLARAAATFVHAHAIVVVHYNTRVSRACTITRMHASNACCVQISRNSSSTFRHLCVRIRKEKVQEICFPLWTPSLTLLITWSVLVYQYINRWSQKSYHSTRWDDFLAADNGCGANLFYYCHVILVDRTCTYRVMHVLCVCRLGRVLLHLRSCRSVLKWSTRNHVDCSFEGIQHSHIRSIMCYQVSYVFADDFENYPCRPRARWWLAVRI